MHLFRKSFWLHSATSSLLYYFHNVFFGYNLSPAVTDHCTLFREPCRLALISAPYLGRLFRLHPTTDHCTLFREPCRLQYMLSLISAPYLGRLFRLHPTTDHCTLFREPCRLQYTYTVTNQCTIFRAPFSATSCRWSSSPSSTTFPSFLSWGRPKRTIWGKNTCSFMSKRAFMSWGEFFYCVAPWAKAYMNGARIFKRLWSPGIDSKEWIPPAYVAWRAGTITLFLLGS